MTNTRSQTIDALKGIAILIVMLGHVLSWNQMEDAYLYDAIKAVQMPLFILISGYLCGIGRRVKTWKEYGAVLKESLRLPGSLLLLDCAAASSPAFFQHYRDFICFR